MTTASAMPSSVVVSWVASVMRFGLAPAAGTA
jgi:hypothetical protein